jgi:hypothetical protein
MYRLKPGIKTDPVRRWALPDRVFFGNGACHILAGVFLRCPPLPGFWGERIIPADGFAGAHVYVTDGALAFDFHGYSSRERLIDHHCSGWAKRYPPGWSAALERVDFDLLSTTDLNARKMLGPDQYGGDPIARARGYLDRVRHVEAYAKAARTVG